MTPTLRHVEAAAEHLAGTPLESWAAGTLRQYRDAPRQARVVYVRGSRRISLDLDEAIADAAHWRAIGADSPVPADAVRDADLVVWEMSAMKLFPAIGFDHNAFEAPVWVVVQRADMVGDRSALENEVLPRHLQGLPDGSRVFVEPDPEALQQALAESEQRLVNAGTTRREAHLSQAFKAKIDSARSQAARQRDEVAKAVDREDQAVRAHRTKAEAAASLVLASYHEFVDTLDSLRTALRKAAAAWAKEAEEADASENGSPHVSLQQAVNAAASSWVEETAQPALESTTRAAATLAITKQKELAEGYARRSGTDAAPAESAQIPDALPQTLTQLVDSFSLTVEPVLGEWRDKVSEVFDTVRDAYKEANAKADAEKTKPAKAGSKAGKAEADTEDKRSPWWEKLPTQELEVRYLQHRTEKDADRAVGSLQQRARTAIDEAADAFARSLTASVRKGEQTATRLSDCEALIVRYDAARAHLNGR